MTASRNIEVHALHWQGVDLEVTFERNWLNIERDQAAAHLSVTSTAPGRAPLPITETGYRSHVVQAIESMRRAPPLAYVEASLRAMGQSRE